MSQKELQRVSAISAALLSLSVPKIESLVAPQDVLVALSTSGDSPNIPKGAGAGRARGAHIVAFTGETGGKTRRQG